MKLYIGGGPCKTMLSWNELYGEWLGSCYSPGSYINERTPYFLDNGAFTGFNELSFLEHLKRGLSKKRKPDFIVAPDEVGNAQKTLELWEQWYPRLKNLEIPLAIAVQDGMTEKDVPSQANIVFVGGTTKWKEATMQTWCKKFPTHIGRCNTWRRLMMAHYAGAISIDGTGWRRKTMNGRDAKDLLIYLKWVSGKLGDISSIANWPYISRYTRSCLTKEEKDTGQLSLF